MSMRQDSAEIAVLHSVLSAAVIGVLICAVMLCGFIGCDACHAVADGGTKCPPDVEAELDGYVLEALCRTLAMWSREGLL